MEYLTNNQIACNSFEDATEIAKVLIRNGYVVMFSLEDQFIIVNFIWSERNSNRNDVVFNHRDVIEDILFNNKESEDK